MEAFFVEDGNKNLLFYYGEPDTNNAKSKIIKSKVQIVDNSNLSLKGVSIFFIRNSTSIAITAQNISQVKFFGSLTKI